MQTILIVIHLLVVMALVAVVLLQRSEGGGLGIGGGGNNAMAARGSGNPLTRATAILAAIFFATSLGLSLMARYGERPTDFLDRIPVQQGTDAPAGTGGVLDQLGGDNVPTAPAAPAAPSADDSAPAQQPAAPAPEAPAAAPETPAAPTPP
ncbi:MAG: preprotein translocase subunit SecG, partial [Aliihoeflea sp.]